VEDLLLAEPEPDHPGKCRVTGVVLGMCWWLGRRLWRAVLRRERPVGQTFWIHRGRFRPTAS